MYAYDTDTNTKFNEFCTKFTNYNIAIVYEMETHLSVSEKMFAIFSQHIIKFETFL